jgi:hypothetical protein
MDVILKPSTKVGCLAAVFSLGLAPILMKRAQRHYPAKLDAAGIVLRDGMAVPWKSITRFRATEFIYGKTKLYDIYEMTHAGGRIRFQSNHIEDATAVVDLILRSLPAGTPTR